MQVSLVDLTVPGWKPSPANIEKLKQELSALKPDKNTLLLCDLVSNVSICFEQINGTLALPVKSVGGYRMHGTYGNCQFDRSVTQHSLQTRSTVSVCSLSQNLSPTPTLVPTLCLLYQ